MRTDVKTAEHQLEIYHTLNVLMEELDEKDFQKQLDAFIALWEKTEPKFIAYFQATYAHRIGKLDISHISLHLRVYIFTSLITEKWAMCYRKYDHGDTDTNMYVER